MALPTTSPAGLICRVMQSHSPENFSITDFIEARIGQPPSKATYAVTTGFACTTGPAATPITSTLSIPATHIQVIHTDGKPYSINCFPDSRRLTILKSIPSRWTMQVQWLNPTAPVIFLNPVIFKATRMFRHIQVPYPINEQPNAGYCVTFYRENQIIGDTEFAGPVFARQSFFKDLTQTTSEVPRLRSHVGTDHIFLNTCGYDLPLSNLDNSAQFRVINSLREDFLKIRTTGPCNTLAFDNRPPSNRSTLL